MESTLSSAWRASRSRTWLVSRRGKGCDTSAFGMNNQPEMRLRSPATSPEAGHLSHSVCPGFLNGMVALANATTNGFPMIQISGSSDRAIVDLQQGDYEELDQMNAAKPYAKAAFRINKPEDIGIGIARAIHAAMSERPGGVYLDLTAEVLSATLKTDAASQSLVRVVEPAPRHIPDPESIKRALDLLASRSASAHHSRQRRRIRTG